MVSPAPVDAASVLPVGIMLITGPVADRELARPKRGIDFNDGLATSGNGPAIEGSEMHPLAELFADEQQPGDA